MNVIILLLLPDTADDAATFTHNVDNDDAADDVNPQQRMKMKK